MLPTPLTVIWPPDSFNFDYYSTFPIREQAKRADWDYELTAVYTIAILDFVFEEGKNGFAFSPKHFPLLGWDKSMRREMFQPIAKLNRKLIRHIFQCHYFQLLKSVVAYVKAYF